MKDNIEFALEHLRVIRINLGDVEIVDLFAQRAETTLRAALDAEQPTQDAIELDCYDAGLLSDHGGGNVEWWQDYMRSELGRAHEFYQSQVTATPAQDKNAQNLQIECDTLRHGLRLANDRITDLMAAQDKQDTAGLLAALQSVWDTIPYLQAASTKADRAKHIDAIREIVRKPLAETPALPLRACACMGEGFTCTPGCDDRPLPAGSQDAVEIKRLYDELIFAVGMKHPTRTRHETALFYIRQAEIPKGDAAMQAQGAKE